MNFFFYVEVLWFLIVKKIIHISQKIYFLQLSSYGGATVTKHLDRDGLDDVVIKSPGIQSNTTEAIFHNKWIKWLASQETVVLYRWGEETNVWLSTKLITKGKLTTP